MKTTSINSPVDVTAIGFGRGMRAYPRRIEFEGATYDFIDAGLRSTQACAPLSAAVRKSRRSSL